MITNEKEVRVAIEAILIAVLVFYGFYGCAIALIIVMLPWKPFLATGAYLVQPILEWREREAGKRQSPRPSIEKPMATPAGEQDNPQANDLQVLDLAEGFATPSLEQDSSVSEVERDVRAAIEAYVRTSPQLVLGNMDLEVRDVQVQGGMAEALVKFQSRHVPDLLFQVRYALCRVGERWEVKSSWPTNGDRACATVAS